MKFPMFIPLTKVDAAQRLVYGSFDETPDRAGEVCDYATAKPAFEQWSESMSKASDGKNLGNIRAQHDMKKAAGKLVEITFDDDAKRVDFCAKIVDDAEWLKVEERVYTGFSPGGSYAKRWKDGDHYRYTPKVGELSIVDVPCNPAATFTLVKADGETEELEFVLGKAYEPGNEATKARAEDMAKAAPGTTFKDHVVQARADLIAENAAEALAKMAAEPEAEVTATDEPAAAEPSVTDKLDAVLTKADETLAAAPAGEPAAGALTIYAAALSGTMLKSAVDLAITPPSPEAVELIGADLAKSFKALDLIHASYAPELAKGLYNISDVACTLRSFAWVAQDVAWEENAEGDMGSPLPKQAMEIVNALKSFLIAMIEEEVAELIASVQTSVPLIDVTPEGEVEVDVMELAAGIIDLAKAGQRLEKAGARNAKVDAARIQVIHDKSCELGAGCMDTSVEKVAALESEKERLEKAVDKAIPLVEALTTEVQTMRTEREADRAELAKMAEQLAVIGNQPAPTRVQLAAEKAADNGTLEKTDGAPAAGSIEEAKSLPPAERQRALEQVALNARHKGSKIPA